MVLSGLISSPLGSLSPQQALQLSNAYLDNAYIAGDSEIALVLCHNTEVSLSQAKRGAKNDKDQAMRDGITTAYIDLGRLLRSYGRDTEADAIYNKGKKLKGIAQDTGRSKRFIGPSHTPHPPERKSISDGGSQVSGSVYSVTPLHIFPENVRPPAIGFKLPEADERLCNTQQLAGCLVFLRTSRPPYGIPESEAHSWLQAIEKDTDEQDRLKTMATEVIRAFKRDELKDDKAITEVVYLAPVLDENDFKKLLQEFYSGIDHSGLLNVHLLEGMAQLIQGGGPGYLDADDLVKILGLLSTRLQSTHNQSSLHMYQLMLAVSHVLDAMADTHVTGLDREKLHEPLSNCLEELKKSSDPYLVYQAAYAFQALLCVPDNETTWQAAIRRTGKVIQGVSGLVSAVKGVDLNKFVEGLQDIQKGVAGASKVVDIVKTAYDNVASLAQNGQGFLESLKEGLSFERKRDWYSALRGLDIMIRDGELATFKKLVYEAPCQRDPAFQWGVCQRLGEIAANPIWNAHIRQDAIEFLGEIYREDDVWGQQASVKQWILNILMQLSSSSGAGVQLHAPVAEALLQELKTNGGGKKQTLYKACRKRGPDPYPLKIILPELASPSLLDRVQNRPDVEGNIRLLRKQRTKGKGNTVYIPPQAKPSLQAADSARFLLMEKVMGFLASEQKVFLLIGDSGAGKSTFNRELELDLWQSYKKKTGRIPLHIHLPAIDKPEYDLVAKQLRRAEFTEPQIREMKRRKFILICDGYDECQQTHNLYMSNRLNQPGEWDAQMVVSCRTEYIGIDYRDRFQPGDRNQQSDSSLFQEAVIAPFTFDQVQEYIKQYIDKHQPLWQLNDYRQALELIPTLKELVRNPFLMTLTLEVLPRIVDPGQNLSTARVTRVGLYDHFVEQWLERGKKRISEKDLTPQSRAVFERLSDEGFTQNGIDLMKRLAAAIYKEQGGKPIVEYSQFMDEGSWKDAFFLRKDKQLLREACPLTRNGNQHRFIHRSLLEYGLARAVFDPHDRRNRTVSEPNMSRRGSVDSVMSIASQDGIDDEDDTPEQEPDINSPLVWRTFVNDHSLLQLLEERAQQEPVFKRQLLAYVEYSKKDKKWRKAAANAITILVRAGVQFIGADLRGIQIPRADLSHGVFDSAQLQDADLRRVNFRGTWLRQTDMSKAQLTGAQFGELPFLTEDSEDSSCGYSPRGNSFAVGLDNGDINIYMTSNWERIRVLSGHTGKILCVVYSPKGDQIASCSEDGTVRLWNSETGSLQHKIDHTDWVRCVAYSPHGNQVASASYDMLVRLFDVSTGDCRQILSGHTGWVLGVAYSPNGQQIASGSADHTVWLWDVKTGYCSCILAGHRDKVWSVVYSPRGDHVASASEDTTVRLWSVETGDCSHVLSGHIDFVYTVAYSPNGDQLASAGVDAAVRIWDAETGMCRQILTGHNNTISSVVYSPGGDQIATSSSDRTVRLWHVSDEASRSISSGHSMEVNSVKCSPRGNLIASCSKDNTIHLWASDTGAFRWILGGHTQAVFGIAYSPQGDLLASGSSDNTVRLWSMETGTCLRVLHGHSNHVQGVAFSPQGTIIASASDDATVLLWDAGTGQCFRTLYGHTNGVLSVVFSPDGNRIATGSMDCTAQIWDADTGTCTQTLPGHTNWVRNIAFSPLGRQLASASYDHTIRLWDVEAGECRRVLSGHSDKVSCVAYSSRNELLASSSWDKTVRLWHVTSGQCRSEIRNLPGLIRSVAWSPSNDDNYFVTGSMDGSVLKWQVTNEREQCHVRLCWRATNGTLFVTGASMQDVRGLTRINKQLLKQRGAFGEPVNQTSKKVITLASVISKLKLPPAGTATDPSSMMNFLVEQLEQLGQSTDHLL